MRGVPGESSVQRAFLAARLAGSTARRGSKAERAPLVEEVEVDEVVDAGEVVEAAGRLRETDVPDECAGFWTIRVPSGSRSVSTTKPDKTSSDRKAGSVSPGFVICTVPYDVKLERS